MNQNSNLISEVPRVSANGSGEDGLLDNLREAIRSASPPLRGWFTCQIEALIFELRFKETQLKPQLAPVKEITPNRMLTVQQASELLNIPVRWLYRHTKRLPHRKLGKYTRFPERDLLKWAEKQQQRVL